MYLPQQIHIDLFINFLVEQMGCCIFCFVENIFFSACILIFFINFRYHMHCFNCNICIINQTFLISLKLYVNSSYINFIYVRFDTQSILYSIVFVKFCQIHFHIYSVCGWRTSQIRSFHWWSNDHRSFWERICSRLF